MKQELTNDMIIEWDVVNWSRALPYWRSQTQLDLSNSSALEIGARDGGLSLWLSTICKNVTYSDMTHPSEKCLSLHRKFNAPNINYHIVNAVNSINLPQHDIIVTKSMIGAIGLANREVALTNIFNNLKENGEYWFIANLDGSIFHRALRCKFVPWGNRWTYLKLNEIRSDFRMFREIEFKTIGFLGTLGRNNFQRNLLGSIDKLFFDKIIPSNMHYIVMGIARK